MHASRLVSVLLLLQTRGRMTASELADELEVSLRTVYRDLDELGAAGIPVYAERGPAGGYQLVDGYRTRLTGLSADEAETLFLSGLEGPAAQLGLGTVLAAAQLKVLAALPPELRSRATRIRERFLLVAPAWFKTQDELASLGPVAQAVWEGRSIQMRYRGPEGPVERRVEPFGLVLKAGIWYLVARRSGALRTYRVSRILSAEMLDERFERPDDFNLGAYWEASQTAFEQSLLRLDVRVSVRSDAISSLIYSVGGRARIPDELDSIPADPNRWVEITFKTDSLETAHDDLLRMGALVHVLAPAELGEMVARTAQEIADYYRSLVPSDVA